MSIKVNEKGMGIIEVIAALGVSVVVLTSLVSLSIFSLRSSLHSKLQLEGSKIANRELELVRAYRDASVDWQTFIDQMVVCNLATKCYATYNSGLGVSTGTFTQDAGTAEALDRYFYATNTSGGVVQSTDQEVRINVVVSWMVGPDAKYARLYTDLTNWANK